MDQLDNKTLDNIADIICGDNLKSKYCEEDDNNCPFYRKGTELSKFFQNAGFNEIHDGSTRKAWTLERLEELNADPFQIEKILLRLANPLEYNGKNTTEIVIKELNDTIFAEGYEIKLDGSKPYIYNLNSTISDEEVNSNILLSEDINDKNLEKTTVKVFISYSTKDKHVGGKIKEILTSFGIECFMAHDDIGVSEEWKQRILYELNEADIFIPILSNNFKDSNWCSQEAGVACFRDILLIPLSLDKNVNPYGFMSHRQGKLIKYPDIPLSYLINPIRYNFPAVRIFSGLIEKLRKVQDFREAEKFMGNLEPYFDKLKQDEINDIVDISIENRQIWDASKCKGEYIPEFIEINQDKIEENKLKELSNLITNGKYFRSNRII